MPRWLQALIQSTLVVGQAIAPVFVKTPQSQTVYATILGAVQLGLATYAQAFNTNGTVQELPGGKAASK